MATSRFRVGMVIMLVVFIAILVALWAYRSRLVSWPDGVNILADGSFEDGTGPGGVFNPGADGVMVLSTANGTTIPGWTVLLLPGESVAWVRNNNNYVQNGATDGTHFLDLTGLSDIHPKGATFGGVRQTFATAAHKPYHLSFDIMVSPNFPGPITVDASISQAPGEIAYAQTTCGPFNPPPPAKQFTTCALDFTAATPSTTLTLVGTTGEHYIGLDHVSVECVAPLGRQGFCS